MTFRHPFSLPWVVCVVILASKVGPETPQSEHLGALFGFLGRPWGHFGGPEGFQNPFETHSKKYRFFCDFRSPPGGGCDNRRRGSPPSKKRAFSAKTAISLQRGANFQFLDFGTPLEKSISLTFSEQWLCHFSKGVSRLIYLAPFFINTVGLRPVFHFHLFSLCCIFLVSFVFSCFHNMYIFVYYFC